MKSRTTGPKTRHPKISFTAQPLSKSFPFKTLKTLCQSTSRVVLLDGAPGPTQHFCAETDDSVPFINTSDNLDEDNISALYRYRPEASDAELPPDRDHLHRPTQSCFHKILTHQKTLKPTARSAQPAQQSVTGRTSTSLQYSLQRACRHSCK